MTLPNESWLVGRGVLDVQMRFIIRHHPNITGSNGFTLQVRKLMHYEQIHGHAEDRREWTEWQDVPISKEDA